MISFPVNSSHSMLKFATNVPALLSKFYNDTDERQQQGFTLYYISINIEGFISGILCSDIAETFGWHYGFALAAGGMLLSNLLLLYFSPVLKDKGAAPANKYIARVKNPASVAFIFAAAGFCALTYLARQAIPSLEGVVLAIISVSIAEVIFAPTIYSYFAKKSPKGTEGLMMGFIPIGYACAGIISGHVGQYALEDNNFVAAFSLFAIISGSIAMLIPTLNLAKKLLSKPALCYDA